ncbi:hypothetical protein ACVSQB_37685 [Bradyrhizobium elkanii]
MNSNKRAACTTQRADAATRELADYILDTAFINSTRGAKRVLSGRRPLTIRDLPMCCKHDNNLKISQQSSSAYLAQLMHLRDAVQPIIGSAAAP